MTVVHNALGDLKRVRVSTNRHRRSKRVCIERQDHQDVPKRQCG